MQEAPTTIAPISSPSRLKTKTPNFWRRRDEGDKTRGKRKLLVGILIALVSFTIIGSASTLLFLNLNHSQPGSPVAKNPIVGQVSFFGSGHIGTDNNTGICDEIHINLKNLTPPTAGHSYYAWLLPDMGNTEEGITTSLGRLTVNNGVASLTFANPTYQNLLLIGSRFLISEESSSVTPSVPTPNQHAWRYYAALPQTPNPQDPNHYSNLNHIRHLLAKDPTLHDLNMQGGLSTWFYTNVQKILEWANTAKGTGQQQDPTLLRHAFIRILDYLDGTQYVAGDVPPGTPIDVDPPQIARVPLLSLASDPANQNPPGYIHHIEKHLQGLTESPDATDVEQTLASKIDNALDKINALLQQVRQDAKQLVNMSNTQLASAQAISIMSDFVKQANDAFVGQLDPATGTRQGGATWIHDVMPQLATLNVKAFTSL